MRYEKAKDIQILLEDIVETLGWRHINPHKIICIRSYGSKSNAYARIWAFPKIWQVALEVKPFYVIEFLSEKFDRLSQKEKIKTVIHELLHIPQRFSGGLRSHKQGRITETTEERWYYEYVKRKKKGFSEGV